MFVFRLLTPFFPPTGIMKYKSICCFDCLLCVCFYRIVNAVTGCLPVYVYDIGYVEGWTVTCWWWLTYCFLPQYRAQSTSMFFFYIKSSQVKDMSAGQNNSWIISSHIHEDQDSKMPVFVFSVSPVSFTRHTVKENSIFKEVSCKYFLKSSTHANRCTAVWKTTRGLSLNSSCGNVWVGWGDANSATVSRHSADVHENDCPTS